jgi:hypothetical protein
MDEALLDMATRAQTLMVQGNRTGARALYTELWTTATATTNPYWACIAAHFLAHTHTDPTAQLDWHLRALHAADAADDARVRPFYPSLHANLGEVYLRLDNRPLAQQHIAQAQAAAALLAHDGYGDSVRALIARVAQTLGETAAPSPGSSDHLHENL